MNNSKMWLVVRPTVGVPLLLGTVAISSLAVHAAVLNTTPWLADYYQGSAPKPVAAAPAEEAAPAAEEAAAPAEEAAPAAEEAAAPAEEAAAPAAEEAAAPAEEAAPAAMSLVDIAARLNALGYTVSSVSKTETGYVVNMTDANGMPVAATLDPVTGLPVVAAQ